MIAMAGTAPTKNGQAELDQLLSGTEWEELRLATVMTGGVSLAVWMGGVTAEISRLLRRDGAYRMLERAVRTRTTLDVVSGTSAGGINGAALALAYARNADAGMLRDVWLREGAFADLLRSPLEPSPLSLLKGDERFLPALTSAFSRLADSNAIATTSAAADETTAYGDPIQLWSERAVGRLRLMVTGTLLQGESRSVADDLGTVVQDVDHRALFRFDGSALREASGNSETVRQLALAARTSASFPGAFEASFVPVAPAGQKPPGSRCDMGSLADFSFGRFLVDGGVLANKPLAPALDAISDAHSDDYVRRVLAYVVPDPGVSAYGLAEKPESPPPLQEVLLRSLIDIPQVQSISRDLARIGQQNARVDGQQRARTHLARMSTQLGHAFSGASSLYDDYRRLRAQAEGDELFEEVTRQLNAARARRELPEDWETELAFRSDLYQQRRHEVRLAFHHKFPAELSDGDVPAALAPLGRLPLEHAAKVALDMLRRRLREPTDSAQRRHLLDAVKRVHDARPQPARHVREAVRERLADVTKQVRSGAPTMLPELQNWVRDLAHDIVAQQLSLEDSEDRWTKLAEALLDVADILRNQTDEPTEPTGRKEAEPLIATGTAHEELRALVEFLLPPGAETNSVISALLDLTVRERVISVGSPAVEQRVELVQISADTRTNLDKNRSKASQKLTGLQLHHFGAFYKRSWRANDWLWGRLDGAGWLVHMLLQPRRIAALYAQAGNNTTPEDFVAAMLDALGAIACGHTEAEQACLKPLWQQALPQAEAELTAALGSSAPPALPALSTAVAAGLQLAILMEELPMLRTQLEMDKDLGASVRGSVEFRAEYDTRVARTGGSVTPRDALALLSGCRICDERLGDEFGSDLMTYTVMTTAATSMALTRGLAGKLPAVIRTVPAVVRGITFTAYALARAVLQRSKTAFAMLCLAFTASVAALAVGKSPSIQGLAWTVLIGTFAVVVLRLPRMMRDTAKVAGVLGVLLAGAAAVFAPASLPSWTGLREWPRRLGEWLTRSDAVVLRAIVAVVALIAVMMLFEKLARQRKLRLPVKAYARNAETKVKHVRGRVQRKFGDWRVRRAMTWRSPRRRVL